MQIVIGPTPPGTGVIADARSLALSNSTSPVSLPRLTKIHPSSPVNKTIPVGVTSELIKGDVFFWGALMAGALLGSVPVAIVYSFFVEYYVSGMTGAVKG